MAPVPAIPGQIISLFGDSDANFSAFAVSACGYSWGDFCAGFQIVATSYFQATGQPLKATVSPCFTLLLLIPMMLILPMFFGLDGALCAGADSRYRIGAHCGGLCGI